MKASLVAGFALGAALRASPAAAADELHWLSPDVLLAEQGVEVRVSDLVGAGFVRRAELAHAPAEVVRFALVSGEASPIDLRARTRPGAVPVAATFLEAGAHLFVLDRAPLSPDGLTRTWWAEKALVRVGPANDPTAGTLFVGQPFEIVPEHDPTDPTVSTIPVRVALHGVAVPEVALIVRRRTSGSPTTTRLVTDESGRVALPLVDGVTLLEAAREEPCVGCGAVQTTSLHASYVFGRGPATVRMPTLSASATSPRTHGGHRNVVVLTLGGLVAAALYAIRERRTLGGPS